MADGEMNERELEELLAASASQAEARQRLRQLLDASPKTLTYKHWLHRLPVAQLRQPVAVVASFTIETMAPFFEVEAYLSGWSPATQYVQYSQWQNSLLDPSRLEGVRVVALLLHHRELLSLGGGDVDEAVEHLVHLVESFRRRTPTPLFMGLIEAPPALHAIAFGEDWGSGSAAAVAKLRAGIAGIAGRTANAHLLDVQPPSLGGADWYDPRGFFTTQSVFAHRALPGLARAIARNMACLFRPRRKVLVLDLDNTLWGGVVGEEGTDGIALGADWPGSAFVEFQKQLRELRRTGILLAISSKNNETDVLAVFEQRREMILTWQDFSAYRINWNDKPANLVAIAQQLDLGLDSFVFADDSRMECALVRSVLPEVEVVELGSDPSSFMNRILATQAFDTLHVSDEDRGRPASYAAEAGRRTLRAQMTDVESFLASSDLRLTIRAVEPKTTERVHQLIGKTNQFNFTLERPSKESVQALVAHGDRLFSATLSDRFGEYGLIGALHLEPAGDEMRIANMVLSCRALGRGVEDALLAFAREITCARGRQLLRVDCLRGPRNQQVFDYLRKVGFTMVEADGEERVECRIALNEGALPWPLYVRVDQPREEIVAQ